MRGFPVAGLLLWLASVPWVLAQPDCVACHLDHARDYAGSAMAGSAADHAFQLEWAQSGRQEGCLECHAPDGGAGVGCRHCHVAGHGARSVGSPVACGRCHQQAFENTLARFREYRARGGERSCLDCHAGGAAGTGHGFTGPSSEAFLEGVVRLTTTFRRADSGLVAVIGISHRAGHGLPGGTAGRAVELNVRGRDARGELVWTVSRRFGWQQDAGRWLDKSLPPLHITYVETPVGGAARIHTSLRYRRMPYGHEQYDEKSVLLAETGRHVPGLEGR